MHASWLKIQEIRRFVFAESRAEKTLLVFVSVFAHIPILVPAVVSPGCAGSILSRYLRYGCIVDLIVIGQGLVEIRVYD